MSRRLIVGLGNPGAKYVETRHNIGFMLIDALANRAGISVSRNKFNGLYGTGSIAGQSVVLAKPETFMNLSGRFVTPMSRYFDVSIEDILIVHDELDLEFGTIRLKISGGHAGHNGLRSIHGELGSNQYHRLRMGIGRPHKGSVSSYVLAPFQSEDERDWLGDFVARGCDAIESAVSDGTRAAMNGVNGT
ncbi:MAG: aminoacyl-tRNA hydrolase [Myxococcales bacterium]|nr:aminoacyl-tRNA hydrolase [Myxococcales bacterium]|tara:strand:- start:515 stop:1084 length:570 start_codon:yes stop_codon:yes gene_type:complete